MGWGANRGASTVIGVILLVAVAVVVGSVVAVGALTFLQGLGTPSATADFSYERTPAGLKMTPEAISTAVTVRLNDRDVTTFSPDSAGQSVLLPTAPGDRITVVSRDGDQSVLVERTIDDRSQIGDFIAYYTFEEGSDPDALKDQSGNGNDGDRYGDPQWTGDSLRFDGDDDYIGITNLNTPVPDVSEFTIAVAYRTESGTEKQELIEHKSGSDNWGLEIKPECPGCSSNPNTYNPNFFVDKTGGLQTGQIFAGEQPVGEREVLVGTYDRQTGSTKVYIDGKPQDSGTFSSNIDMGDLYIGRDAEGRSDYLDGDIYEIRLYYTAFDDREVSTITDAME